ncbi:MAG: NUDIX domain-containing protein [Candidatus Thermoplasmatota archaeon]|jgi:8-oxo-dGTP diphosphatase|nr:NUDIX domain-containing protein [Candidatus Thermoplasmatota archaeon]
MSVLVPDRAMEDRPLLVTAGVIIREGRVLLDRRVADSRFEPLKWEFPGGKVDFGESPQGSLMRELKEELGIRAEVGPFVHLASHVYSREGNERHVVILFFDCIILEGEPQALEGGEVGWFDVNAFSSLDLVEADVGLREVLIPRLS